MCLQIRFLGSQLVSSDVSVNDALVHESIRRVMAARAQHNMFRTNELLLRIEPDNYVRLIDNNNNTNANANNTTHEVYYVPDFDYLLQVLLI